MAREHSIAVVIPVFRGELTLGPLVDELLGLPAPTRTPGGLSFRVAEVVLVDDRGPDGSGAVIGVLSAAHDRVRAIRLARNSGQHGATLAGAAATDAEWVVTMDEDGLHDPSDIPGLLDAAFAARTRLVYAVPVNRPPHGRLRNIASTVVKRIVRRLLIPGRSVDFSSTVNSSASWLGMPARTCTSMLHSTGSSTARPGTRSGSDPRVDRR